MFEERGMARGRGWGGAKHPSPPWVSPPHLQSGVDDFLHGGEVRIPQKLGLLTQGKDPCEGHLLEGSQDLGPEGEKEAAWGPGRLWLTWRGDSLGWGSGTRSRLPTVPYMGWQLSSLAKSQVI